MPTPNQYTGKDLDSICSLLNRPIVLTGVLRDMLTRHFLDANTIEESDLKHLIWRGDDQTGILIESIHRWRPEVTELRPAVIIKRNACQNQRIGIGDRDQGPPADGFGHPHYSTYWTGSHTLFCIGGTGAQAELLGTEVQRELTQFGPLLSRALGLHRFQVMQIGPVAEIEEAQESFTVPVTVGYTYEERWTIKQEAPLLSNISLSKILEC